VHILSGGKTVFSFQVISLQVKRSTEEAFSEDSKLQDTERRTSPTSEALYLQVHFGSDHQAEV